MSDDVDVIEFSRNREAAESTIQDWLDGNDPSSIDHVKTVYETNDRVGLAIVHTE